MALALTACEESRREEQLGRSSAALTLGSCVAAPSIKQALLDHQGFVQLDKTWPSYFGGVGFSVAKVGSEIWAYHVDGIDQQFATGLSKSTDDGVTFTHVGVVLAPSTCPQWDCDSASFPGIYYDGTTGEFFMVYEAGGWVGLAHSYDGVNFARLVSPYGPGTPGLLLKNDTGFFSWEKQNIGTPALYRVGSTWYVFYHGNDGTHLRIGYASGPDFYHLTKHGSPVLDLDSDSTHAWLPHWDAAQLGHMSLEASGGKYWLTYEGFSSSDTDHASTSSGFAYSTDFNNWTKIQTNPYLPTTNGGGIGEDLPTFLTTSGQSWVYYRVRNDAPNTRRARLRAEFDAIASQWGMQDSGIAHIVGSLQPDGSWAAITTDGSGYLQYGPYTTAVTSGDHMATWALQVDDNQAGNDFTVRLDVNDATTGSVLASRDVTRREFVSVNHYECFSLPFFATANHSLEFRVWTNGQAKVTEAAVGVANKNPNAMPLHWAMNDPAIGHATGQLTGSGWTAFAGVSSAGYMQYGPYTTAATVGDAENGDNIATWRLSASNNTSSDTAVTLEVEDFDAGQETLATRTLKGTDFAASNKLEYFSLPFRLSSARAGHRIELRVYWPNRMTVTENVVGVN